MVKEAKRQTGEWANGRGGETATGRLGASACRCGRPARGEAADGTNETYGTYVNRRPTSLVSVLPQWPTPLRRFADSPLRRFGGCSSFSRHLAVACHLS